MSDPVESGQDVTEEAAATANPSGQTDDSQRSQAGGFDAESFKADILGEVSKMVQSQKDKRIADLEKGQKANEDRLDRYSAYLEQGLSPQQAKREIAIDDALLRQSEQPTSPQVNSSVLTGSDAKKAASSLLDGVDEATRNQVLEAIANRAYTSADNVAKDVVSTLNLIRSKPVPTEASMPGMGGGAATSGDDALKAEYQRDMNDALGNPAEVRKVRARYRKKGLAV